MISCSGVSAWKRGVMRRTIHRFEYSSTKNVSPNASPRKTLVRRTVQNTSERRTSRNHRTSTKNPESAVNRTRKAATTATTMMMSRRRPGAGVAVGTRTTIGTWCPSFAVDGRRKPITGPRGERCPLATPEVRQRVVEGGDRNELEPVTARGLCRLHVAPGDQENRGTGVGGRRQLLVDAGDRDHRAVEGDLPRPGDHPAVRQVSGGEQVVQTERPHQPGRGPADLAARDAHVEREAVDHPDPDQRVLADAARLAHEVDGLGHAVDR